MNETWTHLLDEYCLNISRREASLAMGFSHGYLEAIEKGRLRPSRERCLKIAKFFDIPPNDVLALAQLYVPPVESKGTITDEIAKEAARLPPLFQKIILQIIVALRMHVQKRRMVGMVAEEKPVYQVQRNENENAITIQLPPGANSEETANLLQEFLEQLYP